MPSPQSVVLILDQNTVVKPGFWTRNPPPGTTTEPPAATGLTQVAGQVAIPQGLNYVDVVFAAPLTGVPLAPFCGVQRPNTGSSAVLHTDCANVTRAGFRAFFNSPVPTGGYLLSYLVVVQAYSSASGGGSAGTSGEKPMGGSLL